ncbi:MAG: hypothetical protein II824_08845 [Bacteroidales bacterium]|nr:hypothetical protein [Bacteroidales bacterium]
MFSLTREILMQDLRQAYKDACLHKKCKHYIVRFNRNLDERLNQLCDDLWERRYQALPSSCFIVTYPKKREVFAAEFRDRIVHHLYYNYTAELFCRTFIQDTYSCIPGRGTHYGIDRLEKQIRSCSHGYTLPCYVLQMDISGYFMHIDRQRLLQIATESLRQMSHHRILSRVPVRWCDRLDFDFLEYLTREIILLDPTENCRLVGNPVDWNDLPYGKSLFQMPPGRGLPIGNLTSQLYSNVYMNVFDQWMKRSLKVEHYGRYVDDFFVVSRDRDYLHRIIPLAEEFLSEKLGLSIQQGKTTITSVYDGISFLGAFLKPHGVRYIDNKSLHNMQVKLAELRRSQSCEASNNHICSALNSYLGVLVHYRSFNIRNQLMKSHAGFTDKGVFTLDLTKFRPFE